MLSEADLHGIIEAHLHPETLRAWLADHLGWTFEPCDDTKCPLARFLSDASGEAVYVQDGFLTAEDATADDTGPLVFVPGWAEHFIEQIDARGEGYVWTAAEVIELIDAQGYARLAAEGYIAREPGVTYEH